MDSTNGDDDDASDDNYASDSSDDSDDETYNGTSMYATGEIDHFRLYSLYDLCVCKIHQKLYVQPENGEMWLGIRKLPEELRETIKTRFYLRLCYARVRRASQSVDLYKGITANGREIAIITPAEHFIKQGLSPDREVRKYM